MQTNHKFINLEHQLKQRVLLLNTILTVQRGKANSYTKIGQEDFTDKILNTLNNKKEGLVLLLQGNLAINKVKSIIDKNKNFVITTSYPIPLSTIKIASPFLRQRYFSTCNDFFKETRLDLINQGIY